MSVISYESLVSAPAARTPRIGWRNLFRDGTVTVSSAHADHPKELAYDGLTYDGWRATGGGSPNEEYIQVQVASQNADYMAIAAHTLEGATLTPQRSSDGSSWTNLETPFIAQSNRPIVWEWTSVAAAYWRLRIEGADTLQIGAIHVGLKYTLPRGFQNGWKPPSLNEAIEYSNIMSEGGQILGRNVIRRGVMVDAQTAHMTYALAKTDWLDFLDSAERYPVFFWRVMESEAEILYGGLESKSADFSQRGKFVNASFRLAGISR